MAFILVGGMRLWLGGWGERGYHLRQFGVRGLAETGDLELIDVSRVETDGEG